MWETVGKCATAVGGERPLLPGVSKGDCATQMDEAMVAFLSMFYLLDFDYPRCHENGLLVLQRLVFNDANVPEDAAASFNAAMITYRKFKAE